MVSTDTTIPVKVDVPNEPPAANGEANIDQNIFEPDQFPRQYFLRVDVFVFLFFACIQCNIRTSSFVMLWVHLPQTMHRASASQRWRLPALSLRQ